MSQRTVKIFFNATSKSFITEVMYIQIPHSPLAGRGFDILLHIVKYMCTAKQLSFNLIISLTLGQGKK
jgi:hypothetical protein